MITFILVIITNLYPQVEKSTNITIENFVHKQYFHGVPYQEANSYGADAIPILFDLLNDSNEKEYWVNIIVTLGFIENSTALNSLIEYLENKEGEVDNPSFRALISVPFAIGCIASNGDTNALNYLTNKVLNPNIDSYKWSFQEKNINHIISQEAVSSLAISGTTEAYDLIFDLNNKINNNTLPPEHDYLIPKISDALNLIELIERNGRSTIFNP